MHVSREIPIQEAKDIAEKYGYEQVVIMARKTGDDGMEHVTTFGINQEHCAIAKKMGMVLKHDIMGWPQKDINLEPMQKMVPNQSS